MTHRRYDEADVGGLADLLEPPVASRPAGDIAFADTIHVRELHDDTAPPPSGPVIVNDPEQGTQWMTPFAFPLPPASHDVSLSTRLRVLAARARHAVRASHDELRELWAHTLEAVDEEGVPTARDGLGRAAFALRRVRALWSFWQWERGDVLRAGAIGLAVFGVAAAIGAVALAAPDAPAPDAVESAAAMGEEGEVRDARTVRRADEERTARAAAVRTRASRR